MILVALSWIYIFFATVSLGVAVAKIFKISERKLPEISLLGLFASAILAGFWAFFGRINIEFHISLFGLCLLQFFRFRNEMAEIIRGTQNSFIGFSPILKMLFLLFVLVILGQSAAAPFVLDNESYYIQTVKWLNEYGYVKGLANLHVLFAQCSGWHIAQSVFSFSFVYGNFNDLSGFCLLLGNLFAFSRLDDFMKSDDRTALISGLFPLLNIFLLRFSGAPSPDIPVYVITFIIADHFIQNFKNPERDSFNLILILVLFVLFCKASAILLALFPLFMILQNGRKLLEWKPIVLSIAVLGLFIAKNCILSGYPFHPLPNYMLANDYTLPRNIADLYYNETKIYGYELNQSQYNAANWLQLLKRWITLPQLHGLFNKLTLLMIVAVPFFIAKSQNKKALWLLYATMVFQLAILLYGSPQYRYYLNFTLYFSMFCLACLPLPKKIIIGGIGISGVVSLILLLFPLRTDSFTRNENTKMTAGFSTENILFPYANSKFGVSYKAVRKGNLVYQSPVDSPFFWGTGDGNLPCVNSAQLDYIEKYYGSYPQLHTGNIKDGFYSKRTR